MGQASWAKWSQPGAKLTTPACHPTKKVNKAEELTHLSGNIVWSHGLLQNGIQHNDTQHIGLYVKLSTNDTQHK